MSTLTEGLRKGDLEGMVLPMLSIDEYNSKIDNNKIIVVAFYCFEEDPAHDLSNFIERSTVQVQDTDVSPAPSKEGYYVTFIEMLRSPQFPERLMKILNEVSHLTNITDWQFTSVMLPKGKVEHLTADSLKKHVDLKPKATDKREAVKEWLNHSSVSKVWFQEDEIVLERAGVVWRFVNPRISLHLPQSGVLLDEASNSISLRLDRFLEGGYQAHVLRDGVLVEHPYQDDFLMLELPRT